MVPAVDAGRLRLSRSVGGAVRVLPWAAAWGTQPISRTGGQAGLVSLPSPAACNEPRTGPREVWRASGIRRPWGLALTTGGSAGLLGTSHPRTRPFTSPPGRRRGRPGRRSQTARRPIQISTDGAAAAAGAASAASAAFGGRAAVAGGAGRGSRSAVPRPSAPLGLLLRRACGGPGSSSSGGRS